MNFKKETRILGLDDGPFNKFSSKKSIVIGSVFRGGEWLDGVLSTEISVDGSDGTEKLIELITNSRHIKQLQAIYLDGLTFAGMNVIDLEKLHKETKLPVIAVSRKKPDFKEIKNAVRNVDESQKKWGIIKKAGEPIEVDTTQREDEKTIFIQKKGIKKEDAIELTKMISTRSRIPEPIRVSHLIATGVIRGESYGNA